LTAINICVRVGEELIPRAELIDSTEGVISMAVCNVRAGQGLRYVNPTAARVASGYDVERIVRPIAAAALMALMVAGSVALWTVIPIAGLWVASQLSDSFTQIGVVPVLAVAGGIPAAMAFAGKLLANVERLYMRVTGSVSQARIVPAWRRSLGDSRSVRLTVLDRIMVASVLAAVIAMAVWFVAFAGSSLPT
jgi:hypothetical protein